MVEVLGKTEEKKERVFLIDSRLVPLPIGPRKLSSYTRARTMGSLPKIGKEVELIQKRKA